jgi:hypothetical protein
MINFDPATQHNMIHNYDRTDKWSILEYSKKLLGKTLEQAIAPDVIEARKGKGRLGQLVEEYFFGYDVNSNPDADFSDAGLELKVTPLKELKNKTLAIKERLVCTMIDYDADQDKPFELSNLSNPSNPSGLSAVLDRSVWADADIKAVKPSSLR